MTNLIATLASSPSVGFFNSAKKTAPSLPPPIFFTILKSFRVLVDDVDTNGETELGSVVLVGVSCVVVSVVALVLVLVIDGFEATDATSSVVCPALLSEGVGVLITSLVGLSVVTTLGVLVESSLVADIF